MFKCLPKLDYIIVKKSVRIANEPELQHYISRLFNAVYENNFCLHSGPHTTDKYEM
jgi:hypothetical protein